MTWLMTLYLNWRDRRECFHHDRLTGESWIRGQLVDLGRAKHFLCTHCGRYWA